MKNKTVYKIIGLSVLVSLAFLSFLSSCETLNAASQSANNSTSSASVAPSQNANSPASSAAAPSAAVAAVPAAQQQAKIPYSGDGGKGITIAVPRPVMQNSTRADNWMPQLFQDLLTGDLAKFSAMKVIDRANEQMVLAEQNNSASGNYSDDDYIKIGNLTNAQYIVAGNIQNVSGRYNVSFRINNTETNEIKATFNKAYPIGDIETGFAAKEAVKELLAGMGVTLTEAGEESLLVIQQVEVRATTYLAKGMAEEKKGSDVEALAFYLQALESNPRMNEAEKHIQSFATMPLGASIRERANHAQLQIDRWNKIFNDLELYVRTNIPICVYDFSIVEEKINVSYNRVELTLKPGRKIVPNRTVLLVYKTVFDNWNKEQNKPENKDWVGNVKIKLSRIDIFYYTFDCGIYDDYGDRIASCHNYNAMAPQANIKFSRTDQVIAQHKYFDDEKFVPVPCSVPLNKVTDTLTPKIERVYYMWNNRRIDIPFMSVSEWQTWVQRNQ